MQSPTRRAEQARRGTAVDACLGVIESTLQAGDAITFTGFGKFHVTRRRPAGRQPPHRRAGADPGCERPEVLGRVAAQEGSELAGRVPAARPTARCHRAASPGGW